MSDQYTPTGGQTIFPRINFLKTFSSRFGQRSDNGRIFLSGDGGGDAAITYGITSPGGVFNLRSTGTVDYEVDWELTGSREASTENVLPHTYTAGNHTLAVYSDSVYRPYFNNVTADVTQITSVVIGSGADLGTAITSAWYGASNMTTFACPFDVTSSVANFYQTWRGTSLVSFPLLNTSSGTNFYETWRDCSSLTSFPSLLDVSSGIDFSGAWLGCFSLTSLPLLDVSSAETFFYTWFTCTSLADFPANMFDTTGTLSASAFTNAWYGCALTAQSIENILVSLDANGATGITLGIHGGTNAAKTTWSAAAVTAYDNLIVKGWTIIFNA